jgi:hypothetical protein
MKRGACFSQVGGGKFKRVGIVSLVGAMRGFIIDLHKGEFVTSLTISGLSRSFIGRISGVTVTVGHWRELPRQALLS